MPRLINFKHFRNFNLKLSNKNTLILFHFFPDVLIGIGWATIHKICVELLPAQWLSFEQLMISVFLIVACFLWKNEKFRKNTISIFLYLSALHPQQNLVIFYASSFLYFSLTLATCSYFDMPYLFKISLNCWFNFFGQSSEYFLALVCSSIYLLIFLTS